MHTVRYLVLIASVLLLAACGEDGGGPPPGQTEVGAPVTLSYPSGRLMAKGAYIPGTTTRTGVWEEYFDADGSPVQWQRSYVDGNWDKSSPWRESNPDSSIRVTSDDH